ncbi:MAG: response regulator transcription factor [Telluria sp.]
MINVALVDEQIIFREGIMSILRSEDDIEVVGQAARADEIRELLISGRVDVLISEMPKAGRCGTDLIRRLKTATPSLLILILTSDTSIEVATRALKSGAAGYITKDSSSDRIVSSIRGVACGRTQVSESIAEQLMGRISGGYQGGVSGLTDRELDVFIRLARGETCTHIANTLSLSIKTVSTYKCRVMEKMEFSSVAELVKYAVAHKMVPEYSN